eukprot:gene8524-9439_t
MIKELRYADDTTLVAKSIEQMQEIFEKIRQESERKGLYLNVDKTKMMMIGANGSVTVNGKTVEVVNEFNFLGSVISKDGRCRKEIDRRIALAKAAVGRLSKVWKDHNIYKVTKMKIMQTLVFPILLYAAESWTLLQREKKRIRSFELWAWRRMLGIPWMARRTNESVLQ